MINQGEMHYDIISVIYKSLTWQRPKCGCLLACFEWLKPVKDPKFIARRMLILASEDIGNANPNALLLANTCFDAVNKNRLARRKNNFIANSNLFGFFTKKVMLHTWQ